MNTKPKDLTWLDYQHTVKLFRKLFYSGFKTIDALLTFSIAPGGLSAHLTGSWVVVSGAGQMMK